MNSMKGKFLIGANESFKEQNIYADKSSLILEWLLTEGITRDYFSIRELVRERPVSIGLTQKVFKTLVLNGILSARGSRTAKKFFLKKPKLLLSDWLANYSITKKCKMRTYRTGLQNREEVLSVLKNSPLLWNIALALHSAAEVYNCKNTNLQTLELYTLNPSHRAKIEDLLLLEPQEKGYEILLIEPYYKSMLHWNTQHDPKSLPCSSSLHTFLDLYHYPLRGREQAEFMQYRIPQLKKIGEP